jgi:K+-sensing histidine kinase KdpD
MLGRAATFGKLAAQFIFGCVGLAVVTAACFFLQIGLAATAFCYLVVILLFALMDSFLASSLLALLAVAALDYFSAPPLFDFRISDPQDRLVIVPFLLASLIGSGLIQQARSERRVALTKPSPSPSYSSADC